MSISKPVNWGDLRRLSPISEVWGLDRGSPIDRYYIRRFLERHRADITGRVLEVKEPVYARAFGAAVTRVDVLDVDGSNSKATIVADLTQGDSIPSDTFDCFVFTQTLHIIYDIKAVVSTIARILKPGGVLLCTMPAVSRVNYEDGGLDGGDFWRFTGAAIRSLFSECFPAEAITVESHGNVLACTAFLFGLAEDELTREELEFVDPWFPLIFCARIVKPSTI